MKQAPKTIYIERLKKYAVQKYLLGPKFAKSYPEVKNNNDQYILVPEDIAEDHLEEWMDEHIMDNYDYPGAFRPYPHQIYTARMIASHHSLHVHNSQGTGKTMSALWAADHLINIGEINKVLIICTKSGMQNAWEKEIRTHLLHRNCVVIDGTAEKRRKLINEKDIEFFIINHDGATNLIKQNVIPNDFDLIIYDEATAIKNPTTIRFKSLHKYYLSLKDKLNTRIWLLTGTPIAQSPLDAFTQAKLVNPTLIPKNYSVWRDTVMYKAAEFLYVPRNNAHEICYRVLQPSIRFELDDCTDLPKHTFIDINIEKSKQQKDMFKSMAQQYIIETEEDTVTAVSGASKYIKLLQLLAGAIYSENGILEVDSENRFNALCDIIDETSGPLVIFCSFKHIQDLVYKNLKEKYKLPVELINGETSLKERTRILNDFEGGQLKFLIAHPVTLSHSVDLTTSNTIIWYTVVDRNELYLQALDRIRRLSTVKKGHSKLLIYHLISDPLEAAIYKKLQNKTFTQNQLFKLIREELKMEFAL